MLEACFDLRRSCLLPLLLLFATDFLGRGIERYANGLHPEPTLAVGWGAGLLWVNRCFLDGVRCVSRSLSRVLPPGPLL